jgi:phosphoenolpyruvate carboxylase
LPTCMQSSLRKSGDVRLADRKLKDLIRLAETFGFYCCALDVRQESAIHSEVIIYI